MTRKIKVVIGAVYDYLTVIEEKPPTDGHAKALLRCVCGKEVVRNISSFLCKRVNPSSCGCKIKKRHTVKSRREDIFSATAQDWYLGRL